MRGACRILGDVAKILVIDDSKMMRLFLRRCLEKAGYEVEEWVPLSAMEVPDYIAGSKPDLIISDFQMPGCNGSSLARMVHKSNAAVPVLILTAFRDDEMELNLLKIGVQRVLSKPINEASLVFAVKGTLAPPPGEDE